ADQQEKRNRKQRFRIHAVEDFLNDRRQRNVGQKRANEDARHQRKRHRHAEIAEEQEAERHQRQDKRCTHGRGLAGSAVSTGDIESPSSGGPGWSNPWRMPLTSCSIVNKPTSTPEKGMAA